MLGEVVQYPVEMSDHNLAGDIGRHHGKLERRRVSPTAIRLESCGNSSAILNAFYT